MTQHCKLILFLALSFFFSGSQIKGQNLDSLLANKRVYPSLNIGDLPLPRIDGILDDEVWEMGEWQGNFTQQQPVGGVAGTENTYVKVLYDHSNLFVAIICQDSQPELIRDIFDRRDALNGDMTGIAIDSYHDKRTAFEFNLSAAGQKMDLKHLGDYQWDFNWNAVWDGATSMCDSGWIAEMKIPFSQLRYADSKEQLWGMHVWRWISRNHEEDQWQYIPVQAPAMVYLFGELQGVQNIRSSRQVEFLPYVSAAVEKEADMDHLNPFRPNAGIDAKVGISSDYTLDLSINPDFGQVEADPSVLNLTSFETFYEEKRPFFMEGNEIFDFDLDEDIPYYSRRIGSSPDYPENVDSWKISEVPNNNTILGAAKFTGKSKKGLSVGVMNGLTAQEFGVATDESGTEKKIQVAPMSNYLASRVKRDYNEGNTIVGGMFGLVNRMAADSTILDMTPGRAVSGGLDLLHYWKNKNYYFEVKSIASQLQGTQEAILQKQLSHTHRFQRPDADYLEVDSLREELAGHGGLIEVGKNGGNVNFSFMGQYRSPGLNLNDLGYIRQADFMGQVVKLSYRMDEPGDWIRNYVVGINQEARWSFGGENTFNRAGIDFILQTNKNLRYSLNYHYNFSNLDTRELRGGPALRMDGEHQLGGLFTTDNAKDLAGIVGLHYSVYGVGNAHQEAFYGGGNWLPIRKLKFSLRATFNSRKYHQQYVNTIDGTGETLFLVGQIDHRTSSLTFRGELFLNPELSIQYYGSPYFSVGSYNDFKRVDESGSRDLAKRLDPVEATLDPLSNTYTFDYNEESWRFENPDFSFMQFRSNLVFRWEYKLGSTLYLVWAHDRSDWQSLYNPISEITGDLFGVQGNHVFMFKLNFWFSV